MLSRRGWIAAGVVLAAAIGIAAAGTALASSSDQAPAQAAPGGTTGNRINVYSAPFVCGLMPSANVPLDPTQPQQGFPQELPLKPANYATDVNVHNPGRTDVTLGKKAVLTGWVTGAVAGATGAQSGPEQLFQGGQFHRIVVAPDGAFQVDCNDIVTVLQPPGAPSAASFVKGFVVIETTATIDVQDVITSERVGTTVISCLLSDGQVVTASATAVGTGCPAGNSAAGTAGTISIAASNTGTGLTTEVEQIAPDVVSVQPSNNGSTSP